MARAKARGQARLLMAIAAIVALGALAVWLVVLRRPQAPVEAIRPHAVSTYDGVGLGMTMQEVIAAKGVPPTVYGPTEVKNGVAVQEPVHVSSADAGAMAARHDDWWTYKESGARLDVYFASSSNKVGKITCTARTGDGACPPLFGIRIGSSRRDIVSALGSPDLEDAGPGLQITMSYQRYALEFVLARGKLTQIGVVKTVPVPASP
jgi:hypothetical protein